MRNQAATEAFFKQAKITTGITPDQMTTDKEPALYPTIKNIFGYQTKHRDNKYKNNIIASKIQNFKNFATITA